MKQTAVEFKHTKVVSESGNELFFDEQGKFIKENPKQETVVEWLVNELVKKGFPIEKYGMDLFEQAKELEKEQQGYSEEEVVEFANWKDINCFQVMGSNHLFYIRGCKKYDEGYTNKELFETFKNK
jgi:hypothetical protein